MTKFLINTVVSALIIATVAELGRRSAFAAAVLISLPLTSVIALSLLYLETKDVSKVSELSTGIFWLVIPSLGFFLLLPALLKCGLGFWSSLALSSAALAVVYFGYSVVLIRYGISK